MFVLLDLVLKRVAALRVRQVASEAESVDYSAACLLGCN
jgi:hypothetical protein